MTIEGLLSKSSLPGMQGKECHNGMAEYKSRTCFDLALLGFSPAGKSKGLSGWHSTLMISSDSLSQLGLRKSKDSCSHKQINKCVSTSLRTTNISQMGSLDQCSAIFFKHLFAHIYTLGTHRGPTYNLQAPVTVKFLQTLMTLLSLARKQGQINFKSSDPKLMVRNKKCSVYNMQVSNGLIGLDNISILIWNLNKFVWPTLKIKIVRSVFPLTRVNMVTYGSLSPLSSYFFLKWKFGKS